MTKNIAHVFTIFGYVFFFYSLSRFVCAVGSIVAAIIASVDAVGYQLTLKHNLLMYERVL